MLLARRSARGVGTSQPTVCPHPDEFPCEGKHDARRERASCDGMPASRDQAASAPEAFATCVAMASISGGDRQS